MHRNAHARYPRDLLGPLECHPVQKLDCSSVNIERRGADLARTQVKQELTNFLCSQRARRAPEVLGELTHAAQIRVDRFGAQPTQREILMHPVSKPSHHSLLGFAGLDLRPCEGSGSLAGRLSYEADSP